MMLEAEPHAEQSRQAHWDEVYAGKGADELSWHQDEPSLSLALISAVAPGPQASVIDVGGGNSVLVDRLLALGYATVTVLDISPKALDQSKARLGELGRRVRWEVADVTQAASLGCFDVWHDRAVFHFLTREEDRQRYVALAERSIATGGHLIMVTFALDGPERCSGLPVCRYDAASLARVFANGFELVSARDETHLTPWGAPQKFTYCVLRRV
ncbi:MAG: class I SAM-dependent methyltransferase [Actinomycetota bacterium]